MPEEPSDGIGFFLVPVVRQLNLRGVARCARGQKDECKPALLIGPTPDLLQSQLVYEELEGRV
jgi:hypothetical protein